MRNLIQKFGLICDKKVKKCHSLALISCEFLFLQMSKLVTNDNLLHCDSPVYS